MNFLSKYKDNHNAYLLKQKTSSTIVTLIKFLFLAGMCYLFLFPILFLLVTTLQDPASANDPSIVWIPTDITMTNLNSALAELDYSNSAVLSVVISIGGTLAVLFSCAMVGYALARYNFWEKNIAFALVIVLIIIPPQTTTISTFLNFRFFDLGGLLKLLEPIIGVDHIQLTDSPIAMILPALLASGIRAGLSIFIFRQFFLGQPKELEEAAKIDGCGALSTYFRIMLPLSTPAIITVSVFSFVWYWNDSFFTSLFFTDTSTPLAAKLAILRNTYLEGIGGAIFNGYEQKGTLAAAALLCVVPPLILYLIIQRYFTESIERTGIVG